MRQLFQEGKKERPELSLVRAPSLLPFSPSLLSTMAHIAVGTHCTVVTESLPNQAACPVSWLHLVVTVFRCLSLLI